MNWAALRTIVFLWPATSRLFDTIQVMCIMKTLTSYHYKFFPLPVAKRRVIEVPGQSALFPTCSLENRVRRVAVYLCRIYLHMYVVGVCRNARCMTTKSRCWPFWGREGSAILCHFRRKSSSLWLQIAGTMVFSFTPLPGDTKYKEGAAKKRNKEKKENKSYADINLQTSVELAGHFYPGNDTWLRFLPTSASFYLRTIWLANEYRSIVSFILISLFCG